MKKTMMKTAIQVQTTVNQIKIIMMIIKILTINNKINNYKKLSMEKDLLHYKQIITKMH